MPRWKCVYLATDKTFSFYSCKMFKAGSDVLKNPFTEQKPRIMLFGGDGAHWFARKTSRDYKKGKLSSYLKKVVCQSILAQPTLCQKTKKPKNKKKTKTTPHWLIQLTKNSVPISFYTLSVNSKATSFSQSPTMVLSGFLTLNQIQLHWL